MNLQILNDKGQGIKKNNPDGSINESWLEIHRPWESKKNKEASKVKGVWDGYGGKGSSYPKH